MPRKIKSRKTKSRRTKSRRTRSRKSSVTKVIHHYRRPQVRPYYLPSSVNNQTTRNVANIFGNDNRNSARFDQPYLVPYDY
jgi:hypothetical protein